MELRGLFQYLVNQLKKGNGIELVLLQELIQQMANVQYTENMTEEQLDAMAGSETLRYQATSFGVPRNNKALVKSTNRLRDSLFPKEEPKLAVPLLLLIAQHRSVVVIGADAPHIKMVSEQFDRCHGTLLQYVEFLASAVTPASAYAQLIPTLHDLIHLYHLDPEVAFLIYRPVMRLFKCQSSSEVFWPLHCDEIASAEKDVATNLSSQLVLDLGSARKPITWSALLDTARTMLPPKAWNSLSPDLYATFWGLTLYDLYVPRNRYESEISKLHSALKALEELSDNSNSAITKRKKDKERIQESLDRLTSELQKHESNVASVRRRLSHEKDNWLSNCPDTLKINMEFLQRCIFPRCTFSMPDAVYCAMFVNTLHSLGTPFFNTVNHIDVLICKTLQPMICCCTEYEVGRLGRFLSDTLRTAYLWKKNESIYERECGNMPGFAVYYRYPNSQRVTYGQFIKVHWKWSQRITRLLIQCLESPEYMEIRNALILLTKISAVFPVTRKSGINLEKRVAKIKSDEREDLKVLATGVAAALAARKSSWVTEEEFGMGYLDLKPVPPVAPKSLTGNVAPAHIGSGINIAVNEPGGGRTKPGDAKSERTESVLPAAAKSAENQKQGDESGNKTLVENTTRVFGKASAESEGRAASKRSVAAGSLSKQTRQDFTKDDGKSGKAIGRTTGTLSTGDKDLPTHDPSEGRQTASLNITSAHSSNGLASAKGSASTTRSSDIHGSELKSEGGAGKSFDSRLSSVREDANEVSDPQRQSSRQVHSPRHEFPSLKSVDKPHKRINQVEELDRLSKRRKGDIDSRELEADIRFPDRERSIDQRLADKPNPADIDRPGSDEQMSIRAVDRSKEKVGERYDRDHRDRIERLEKSRGDDNISEKSRDRSMERHGRERSVDKLQERGIDRGSDRLTEKSKDERNKDDRIKSRYNDTSQEKSHTDDRFHGQSLPPPPPLPAHMVPQSVSSGRRDDDGDRRLGTARHTQRLSPRHEERERKRSEENTLILQDDAKRRREDEFRDRKREERDVFPLKVEEREREREREKAYLLKEDLDASVASKKRKLKREHPQAEAGEYLPPGPPPLTINLSQPYDGRERAERAGRG